MFVPIIICTLIIGISGLPNDRIIGGHDAKIEDYPYQVSLQTHGQHFCGGSLISDKYIVTAAHCTDFEVDENYTVRLGSSLRSSGGVVIKMESVTLHPDFNTSTTGNDIAIIELAESVEFSDQIKPIDLPSSNEELDAGTEVSVSGWGDLLPGSGKGSEKLQAVELNIVSHDVCQDAYDFMEITDNMICANVDGGGKDSCQEDSGGPLAAEGKLFGVVSFGVGCGEAEYPGVYASVPNLRDFITDVTGI